MISPKELHSLQLTFSLNLLIPQGSFVPIQTLVGLFAALLQQLFSLVHFLILSFLT